MKKFRFLFAFWFMVCLAACVKEADTVIDHTCVPHDVAMMVTLPEIVIVAPRWPEAITNGLLMASLRLRSGQAPPQQGSMDLS
jgi:hypothetical protein